MVVLEQACVVELDRHRPIKARLIHGFQPAGLTTRSRLMPSVEMPGICEELGRLAR